MSFQAGDLPQDIEKLRALVRALQAENTQLRSLLKGVSQQAFGVRSERASVILGDQGHLALGAIWPGCRPTLPMTTMTQRPSIRRPCVDAASGG